MRTCPPDCWAKPYIIDRPLVRTAIGKKKIDARAPHVKSSNIMDFDGLTCLRRSNGCVARSETPQMPSRTLFSSQGLAGEYPSEGSVAPQDVHKSSATQVSAVRVLKQTALFEQRQPADLVGAVPFTRGPLRRVVVIGGGVAGSLAAMHLQRGAAGPLAITVLEPRERLGYGVAYSTPERCHITNVPASRMSADPDDPDSLVRWLAQRGDALQGDERDSYPRRALFGDYVRDLLVGTRAACSDSRVTHLRETACDVVRRDDQFAVDTAEGRLEADAVVLATGNPAPVWPAALRPIATAPGCIGDPWSPGALAGISPEAHVLIVGTGLTMGDTVATLRDHGHRGAIVAISRRGQVPQRGLAQPAAPFGNFAAPPQTARGLVRLVRSELDRAEDSGRSWYAVLAAARGKAWSLWIALPPTERRRFARHVRHLYELHRHVMPGPVHDLVSGERAGGSLSVLAGALVGAEQKDGAIVVTWRPRGHDGNVTRPFNALINCTGPTYASLTETDPLWAALARRGLVAADPTGLGPAVDSAGRAVNAAGTPEAGLLVVGTLARAAFGELTGIREITLQARLAAAALLQQGVASG